MAQVRHGPGAMFLALLLAVGLCGSCRAAEVVPVRTAEEFLNALASAAAPGAPQDTVLELHEDIALSEAAASIYRLPFVIGSNHTITVQGGEPVEGQLTKLDFGKIAKLLSFKGASSLVMNSLNISGMKDRQLGSWPANVDSPTVAQTMPFWPTIIADPGYTSGITDSYVTLHPTELCSPEIGATQFAGLEQLAKNAGSSATDLYTNGTVGYFVDWAAPVPVLSATTKVATGTVFVHIRNTTLHCSQPDAEEAAASPASVPSNGASSSSGGTPGWVWALVGVAAGLAVAAVPAGLLWCQRRKRIDQEQRQRLMLKGPDSKACLEHASQPTKTGSDGIASGTLTSAGNSGMWDGSATASVPEGPWRTRVGFIDGLQLGGLLGRGGYARVYKGRWKGTMVAVKVIEAKLSQNQRLDLRSEPLLSLTLSHPNVLQGYKMCTVKVITDGEQSCDHASTGHDEKSRSLTGGSGDPGNSGGSCGQAHSGSRIGSRVVPHLTDPNCMVEIMPADAVLEPGMYEMWLVSELADKGTLADATKAGWFAQPEPPGCNIPAILLCLLDVARGLEYLHSCSIMHGDLKPQNVLLKTAGSDWRGFVCKLGDFGLSRILQGTETHVNTGSYGTVTHAAPELLSEGRLTKACDVFAFGMMLWELVTGQQLFPDMQQMQIIIQVTQRGYRPPIPPDFPPPLADLARRCWDVEPHARPNAAVIVQDLIDYSATFSSTARRPDSAATDVPVSSTA